MGLFGIRHFSSPTAQKNSWVIITLLAFAFLFFAIVRTHQRQSVNSTGPEVSTSASPNNNQPTQKVEIDKTAVPQVDIK